MGLVGMEENKKSGNHIRFLMKEQLQWVEKKEAW